MYCGPDAVQSGELLTDIRNVTSDEEQSESESEEEEVDVSESEEEEEEVKGPSAYELLLKELGPEIRKEANKKRKKDDAERRSAKRQRVEEVVVQEEEEEETESDEGGEAGEENDDSEEEELVGNVEGQGAADDNEDDSDDETTEEDPFKRHFGDPSNEYLKRITAVRNDTWASAKALLSPASGNKVRVVENVPKLSENTVAKVSASTNTSIKSLHLKDRLVQPFEEANGPLTELQKELAGPMFDYKDILYAPRTPSNAAEIRRLYCVHALNLIQKTRDRVLKNSLKLAKNPTADLELRDQGFTRTKVLIITPTRNSCAEIVDTLVDISAPEQEENKKRFDDGFRLPKGSEDPISAEKPEDFRALFKGNHDDMFRLGVKYTRKTMQLFSGFYKSDIVIASPLGLRMIIGDEGDKKRDFDYLSSVELVIVDQAEALMQQNWDHVEHIFKHLNLIPKESHGCDFGRVRNWYLDQNAPFLRQNLIFSSFLTPSLNALWNTQLRSISGRVKIAPEYPGVLTTLGVQTKQTFLRFQSATPAADPDTRFSFFTEKYLPTLTRRNPNGILLFIPSYFDFLRVRNYFANLAVPISFGSISEETPSNEIVRTRAHFLSGRHSFLLYSGRAHHFRRFIFKGVKRVVFYQPPDNAEFYREAAGTMLARSSTEGREIEGATVVFSKWDGLALERLVGSKRVGSMVREEGADVFEFM